MYINSFNNHPKGKWQYLYFIKKEKLMFREVREFVQDGIVEVMGLLINPLNLNSSFIKSRQIFSLLTSQKSCAVEVICKSLQEKS